MINLYIVIYEDLETNIQKTRFFTNEDIAFEFSKRLDDSQIYKIYKVRAERID